MGTTEAAIGVGDEVFAELVECAPPRNDQTAETTSALAHAKAAEGLSPTREAQKATEAQTGADPPPSGKV